MAWERWTKALKQQARKRSPLAFMEVGDLYVLETNKSRKQFYYWIKQAEHRYGYKYEHLKAKNGYAIRRWE